jgi:hypothetical protein
MGASVSVNSSGRTLPAEVLEAGERGFDRVTYCCPNFLAWQLAQVSDAERPLMTRVFEAFV